MNRPMPDPAIVCQTCARTALWTPAPADVVKCRHLSSVARWDGATWTYSVLKTPAQHRAGNANAAALRAALGRLT